MAAIDEEYIIPKYSFNDDIDSKEQDAAAT
jgi:hypothetical protein